MKNIVVFNSVLFHRVTESMASINEEVNGSNVVDEETAAAAEILKEKANEFFKRQYLH